MSNNLSPAPGVPQTPYKAYAATAAAAAVSFVMYWVADTDPFTGKEIASGIVGALVANGIVTGGAAYLVKNKRK